MRFFALLVALFFSVQLLAQDAKGYYINGSGQRTEGFFKYGDYNDTPSVKFRSSRNAEYAPLPNDVSEFGLDEDRLKFEKHTVQIDISGNESTHKNPEFLTKTIFLNVVLSGNAKLYSYTQEYTTKFFFSTQNKPGEVSQLVYKKYKLSEGTIAENTMFRQQLYNAVKCNGQTGSDFTDVAYDKKQLVDIFKNYNDCTGSKSEILGPRKKSDFKYTVSLGVYNTNLYIPYAFPDVDDANDITYGAGIEVAYVFPSETTELFFSAELESLKVKSVSSRDLGYNITTSTYDVNSMNANIYIGGRYNFLLDDDSKIFLDGAFGASIPFGDITQSTIITTPTEFQYPGVKSYYEFQPAFCLNFSLGYAFKKFGVTIKYETDRDFLDDVTSSYKTNIHRLGLNLRYTLN